MNFIEEVSREIVNALSEKNQADERAKKDHPTPSCREEMKFRLNTIYKEFTFKYYDVKDRIDRVGMLSKVSLFISVLAVIIAAAS